MRNRLNEETSILNEPPAFNYLVIEDTIQKALEIVPGLKDIPDIQENLYPISRAINLLFEAQLLDCIELDLLISHQNADYLAEGLIILNEVGISAEYRLYLTRHIDPYEVAESFEFLDKFNLLNHRHAELIAKSVHPKNLALALQSLHQNQITWSQELTQTHLDELAKIVFTLSESDILTQQNIDTLSVKTQDFLINTNSLFMFLKESKFINQANFDEIMNLDALRVDHISYAFMFLYANRLSNQENFDALLTVSDTPIFIFALCKMSFARILTQANLNVLIHLVQSPLLSPQAQDIVWYRLPDNLLTQEVFNLLVQASNVDNPLERFQDIMFDVLGMDIEQRDFNEPQSTHTASVHRSVSKSAIQLQKLYGSELNMDKLLPNIMSFVNSLSEESLKHQASKRCISRLLDKHQSFLDPASNLNLITLFGLVFMAIHDERYRIGDFDDAQVLLIEALYEIQRGYNFDEKGFDLGGEDKPICAAGSFNKLIEKLVGVHQLCEIIYVTPNVASYKLQQVVINEANFYLQSLDSPKTMRQAMFYLALISEVKREGVGAIWSKIKDKVRRLMLDDFQEMSGLDEIIEAGQYGQMANLEVFEQKFETSKGHSRLNKHILIQSSQFCVQLNKHSLWANRQQNPKSQILFDKQWGLIPR